MVEVKGRRGGERCARAAEGRKRGRKGGRSAEILCFIRVGMFRAGVLITTIDE